MAHEYKRVHEGIIFKKGQINKSWKQRYFILFRDRRLAYFENEKSIQPIKEIDLSLVHSINIIPNVITNKNGKNGKVNAQSTKQSDANEFEFSQLKRSESIRVASLVYFNRIFAANTNIHQKGVTDRQFSFELATPKRKYLLSCRNEIELNQWIDCLEQTIFGARLYEGYLIKRGAYRKSWKKRFFVVYDTQEMRYYDDQDRKDPKGLIKLHEVLLMCPGDKDQYTQPYTIQLMTPDRNWVLATESQKERDQWFSRLEETIHGAKRLVTSHEGYLYKKGTLKIYKKRYFALSKGWLFYFEEQFHCNKFKSIAFFSEAFFNQAFRLYVKGSIPLHQTTVQKIESKSSKKGVNGNNAVFNDADFVNSDYEKEHAFKIITQKREFYLNDLSNEEESEYTITHDLDEDEYSNLIQRNDSDFIASDGDDKNNQSNKNEENMDDEKTQSENRPHHQYSETPLMDIIDPEGTGKWVDVEDKTVEEKQSNVLLASPKSKSFKSDKVIK